MLEVPAFTQRRILVFQRFIVAQAVASARCAYIRIWSSKEYLYIRDAVSRKRIQISGSRVTSIAVLWASSETSCNLVAIQFPLCITFCGFYRSFTGGFPARSGAARLPPSFNCSRMDGRFVSSRSSRFAARSSPSALSSTLSRTGDIVS